MNELMGKIYEQVICQERIAIERKKKLDQTILELIPKEMKGEEEQIKDLLFAVGMKAEQEGFYLGVKYAMEIMRELKI
ncbi:MAG: hypothetical protein R3Y54_01950 [Eubacteriales bacterium]